MSVIRPRTSQSPQAGNSLAKYLLSYKKFSTNTDHPPSLSSKFTRRRFKQELSQYSNTEQAYNTRNGVLNTSLCDKRPGGNGYCSILRLKKALQLARIEETEVDRRIKDAKIDYIRSKSPLIDHLYAENHPEKRTFSRVSQGNKRKIVPKSFHFAAIRCSCEEEKVCLCGKRELQQEGSASMSLPQEKIAEILSTCDNITKETNSTKAEMKVQLGQVKQKLGLFSRHTNLIMMGLQRAKYFSLRKKFQVATRVNFHLAPRKNAI